MGSGLQRAVAACKASQRSPGLVFLSELARQAGYGRGEYEFRFAPPRRFRFDLAWPGLKVALERDGGTWGKSRHTSGVGFRDDARKLNLAASLGWLVCRATVDMIEDGTAGTDLLAILAARKAENP